MKLGDLRIGTCPQPPHAPSSPSTDSPPLVRHCTVHPRTLQHGLRGLLHELHGPHILVRAHERSEHYALAKSSFPCAGSRQARPYASTARLASSRTTTTTAAWSARLERLPPSMRLSAPPASPGSSLNRALVRAATARQRRSRRRERQRARRARGARSRPPARRPAVTARLALARKTTCASLARLELTAPPPRRRATASARLERTGRQVTPPATNALPESTRGLEMPYASCAQAASTAALALAHAVTARLGRTLRAGPGAVTTAQLEDTPMRATLYARPA